MNSSKLISDIYKKFKKPPRNQDDLHLEEFVQVLSPYHNIKVGEADVELTDLEEFNPFRRFLKRSLTAILDFDKHVAFVFVNHILFFHKESDEMRIHIKPDKQQKSWFAKLFK